MTDRDIQRDRLKEIVKDSLMKHIDKTCSLAENITNDLLSNGVIVPPCKVGDYVLWDNGLVGSERVMKEVKGFYYDSSGLGLRYILEDCTPTVNFCSIVGILTKEEAEAKLRERNTKND